MSIIEAIEAGPCPDCRMYHPKNGPCKAQRRSLKAGSKLTDSNGNVWTIVDVRADGSIVLAD